MSNTAIWLLLRYIYVQAMEHIHLGSTNSLLSLLYLWYLEASNNHNTSVSVAWNFNETSMILYGSALTFTSPTRSIRHYIILTSSKCQNVTKNHHHDDPCISLQLEVIFSLPNTLSSLDKYGTCPVKEVEFDTFMYNRILVIHDYRYETLIMKFQTW